MKRWIEVATVASVAMASLIGPTETARAAGIARAAYATVGARTTVPYGWVDFCNRYAPECDGPRLEAVDIDLTPKTFALLEHIDVAVNKAIEPKSDMDHWGVIDRWDYPLDRKGDCEDYALMKRKLLMEAGFPRQALLMTVVKDLDGDGHAILTVKTNKGEYVLDNLNDHVKLWSETGYKFVKRQSQEDPNLWLIIGPPAGEQVVSTH